MNQLRYDPTTKSGSVPQISPSFLWGNAFGMMQTFKYLRGLWPPGGYLGGNILDQSACGTDVTPNGANAVVQYSATNFVLPTVFALLTTAGFFGNVAAESNYRASAANGAGVTALCWARVDAATGGIRYLVDKSQTANQICYSLRVNNMQPEFMVSLNGIATTVATCAAKSQAFLSEWHFYAGTQENGGNLSVYCDTEMVTVAGPATVFAGTSPFYIGYNMVGEISLVALTVFPLPETVVRTFYEMTRPIFGNVRP